MKHFLQLSCPLPLAELSVTKGGEREKERGRENIYSLERPTVYGRDPRGFPDNRMANPTTMVWFSSFSLSTEILITSRNTFAFTPISNAFTVIGISPAQSN